MKQKRSMLTLLAVIASFIQPRLKHKTRKQYKVKIIVPR
jgi:hypothetical protein